MDLYALYRHPPPTATEVFRVWCEAHIPAEATVHDIAVLLDTWARDYCSFLIIDGKYHVCWISPTGTRHDVPYDTLVHWMLCAAVPVKPPAPVMSPPLAPQVAPVAPPAVELGGSADASASASAALASATATSASAMNEFQSSLEDSSDSHEFSSPAPKFVPESKPSAPKPVVRADTPRPMLETELFNDPESAALIAAFEKA